MNVASPLGAAPANLSSASAGLGAASADLGAVPAERSPGFVAYRASQRSTTGSASVGAGWWPSWSPQATKWMRAAAADGAVLAACSWATARTITPSLLALADRVAAQGAQAPFWPTRLLAQHLGQLGGPAAFAVLGASLVAVGGLNAALLPPDGRKATLAMLATQVGLGLLLSPFWLLPAGQLAAATPAVVVAVLATAALQASATYLRHDGRMGLLLHLATVGLLWGAAPLAAKIASGAAVGAALGEAVFLATSMGIVATASLWSAHLGNTDDRDTAAVRRYAVAVPPERRLNTADELAPEVFVHDADFHQAVAAIRANLRAHHPVGATFLLQGPPGCGKSAAAQALANLGPWTLHAPSIDDLLEAPSPAAAVVQLFDEARRLTRRTGRSLVLFFDEGEALLAAPNKRPRYTKDPAAAEAKPEPQAAAQKAATDAVAAEASKRAALADAFKIELDDVRMAQNRRLVVVVATNHPERLDKAIYGRLASTERIFATATFHPPTAADLGQIATVALRRDHAGFAALRRYAPHVPTAAEQAALAQSWHARAATGRRVVADVGRALQAANAHFATAVVTAAQGDFAAFVAAQLQRRATAS